MNALALIVEDEAPISEILDRYLVREGFRTARAYDGQVALELHGALKPDVVLLDVMLPKIDGWRVLAEIRRRSDTPVLMMTALDQDVDKLQALRMGADDYVVKPFSPLEVVARVNAVLRRAGGATMDRVIRAGPIEVHPESYAVAVRREEGALPLSLTLTEFRIMELLARHPMRVFTRSDIVDACLPGEEVLDRTVDSHMSKLRRKFTAVGLPDIILGVRGVGYRMNV